MPDTFVPMAPVMMSGTGNGFTPLPLRPGPLAAGKAAAADNGHAAAIPALAPPPAHACAAPKVTLQRQGEMVSSIRIQCGCGQVIELNCVY